MFFTHFNLCTSIVSGICFSIVPLFLPKLCEINPQLLFCRRPRKHEAFQPKFDITDRKQPDKSTNQFWIDQLPDQPTIWPINQSTILPTDQVMEAVATARMRFVEAQGGRQGGGFMGRGDNSPLTPHQRLSSLCLTLLQRDWSNGDMKWVPFNFRMCWLFLVKLFVFVFRVSLNAVFVTAIRWQDKGHSYRTARNTPKLDNNHKTLNLVTNHKIEELWIY